MAELADRLAAVLRAGISPSRSWTALAGPPGGQARVEAPARPLSSGTRGTRSRTGRNDAVGEVVQLVAAAVAAGAGEAEAIRAAASQSPAPGVGRSVAWLGVAWEVGVTTGAPLAEVLDGFATGARASASAQDEREVALAGPRATAAVLTLLPVVTLVLAGALGADPLRLLFGTVAGRLCALTGGSAWLAGRWWVRRLVASAAEVPA